MQSMGYAEWYIWSSEEALRRDVLALQSENNVLGNIPGFRVNCHIDKEKANPIYTLETWRSNFRWCVAVVSSFVRAAHIPSVKAAYDAMFVGGQISVSMMDEGDFGTVKVEGAYGEKAVKGEGEWITGYQKHDN